MVFYDGACLVIDLQLCVMIYLKRQHLKSRARRACMWVATQWEPCWRENLSRTLDWDTNKSPHQPWLGGSLEQGKALLTLPPVCGELVYQTSTRLQKKLSFSLEITHF